MKKILCAFSLLCIIGCSTSDRARRDEPAPVGQPAPAVGENEGWHLFSQGLLYKNQFETSEGEGREEYLAKAINFLERALENSGENEHSRIYAHLADCYYYQGDIDAALSMCRRAMAADRTYQAPYNRAYSIYMKLRNYRQAGDVLAEYLRADPGAIHFRLALGELYLKNINDLDRAEKEFMAVLEMADRIGADDYYRHQACADLGYVWYRRNDVDKSIDWFEKANVYGEGDETVIFMLCHLHMVRYHIQDAERYGLQYDRMVPGNDSIASVMGRIRYLRREPSAMTLLKKGGTMRSVDGLTARALYLEMTGDNQQAEKAVREVLGVKPDSIEGRIALASLLEKKGDRENAALEYVNAAVLAYNNNLGDISVPLFRKAIELGDKRVELHYYLGRIDEDAGRYAGAIYNYSRLDQEKTDMELMLHIGYLHGLRREYDTALTFFDRAIKLEPANPKPVFFRGLGSMWVQRYDQAEEFFFRTIGLGGTDEKVYFYLAVVQEKQKKNEKAIESLEKALAADPGSARSMNFLGYMLADLNMRLDEAQGLIGKALEIEPDNGAYIDSMGWVMYRKGQFDRALEYLLRAEKKLDESGSPDPVVYEHIGDTYMVLGEREKAIEYWKKSLRMDSRGQVREKILKNGGTVPGE